MHPNKVIVVFDKWTEKSEVFTERKPALDSIVDTYRKGSDDHQAIVDFLEDEGVTKISLIAHVVSVAPFNS